MYFIKFDISKVRLYNYPMSPEIKFEGIPEEFQPLFQGSAREVISFAASMVSSVDDAEQKRFLETDIFCRAVNSALFNLDQRKRQAAINFISNFDKDLQAQAFKTFLGEDN